MPDHVSGREHGGPDLRDRLRFLSWLAGALLIASVVAGSWGYLRDRRFEAATRHDNALIIATERLLSSL